MGAFLRAEVRHELVAASEVKRNCMRVTSLCSELRLSAYSPALSELGLKPSATPFMQ